MYDIDNYNKIEIQEFKNIAYFEYADKGRSKIKIPDAMVNFLKLDYRQALYPIIRRNKDTGLLTIFINFKQSSVFKNNPVYLLEQNHLYIKNNERIQLTTYRPFEISVIYYEGINTYALKLQELKEIRTKEK